MLASTGDGSRSLISTIRRAIRRDKIGDGQLPNFSPRRDSKAVCAALNVYDKYAKKCSKAGRKGGCESCRNTDLDPPTPIMAPVLLPSGPNIEPQAVNTIVSLDQRRRLPRKLSSMDHPAALPKTNTMVKCNDCSTPNPAPVEAPILPL